MQMRFAFDLSVADVSRLTGASRASIYKWEKGETVPTLRQLVILAAYYECKVDDLIVTYF